MSGGGDAWRWWEARRLRYNLALAAAGVAAYGLWTLLPVSTLLMRDWRAAISTTLILGVLYLLLIGVANICYLIGPALEAWLKPADPRGFRRRAYSLGFWGSVAAPFAFPALALAWLIAIGP